MIDQVKGFCEVKEDCVYCLLLISLAFSKSSITCIRASIVFRPGRNPYCLLFAHNDLVWMRTCLTMIRLNTLHSADVSAIGLKSPGCSGLLVFGIGMILATYKI